MNSRSPVKNSPSQLTGSTDGFESRSVMNKFVAEFDKYKNQWQTMSPSQRENALKNIIKETLTAAGIPIPKFESVSTSSFGEFYAKEWSINISPDLLSGEVFRNPKRLSEQVRQLGLTLYHEMRHAEAHFRIVQYLASPPPVGKGLTASQIATQTYGDIHPGVIESAYKSIPAKLSASQIQKAKLLYQGYFGSDTKDSQGRLLPEGRKYTESVYTEFTKQKELLANRIDAAEAKRGTVLSAQQRSELKNAAYRRAEQNYLNLSGEADAWAIERALKDNYPQFRPGQSSKSSEKSASAEQQIMEESVAAQRYQAIAKLLKESGLQEGSTDWGKAVVQVSIGTELDIAEVKDIAKEIPGLKPSQAEGLVDSFQSSNQLEFV
jgi:hypothetical protein